MRLVNEKLVADLLEMGKKEFLLCGFQGADLWSVVVSMGATTGAIYRYYTDKVELFGVPMEKPAAELLERYREIQKSSSQPPLEQQLPGLSEISDNGQIWMMKHVYDNFDVFKPIICCFFGTRYEHYIDELVEIEVNVSHVLIDWMNENGYKPRSTDDELIHTVSGALFNGMSETIRHDVLWDKAFAHMDGLREFYSVGWSKILGISQLRFPIYL